LQQHYLHESQQDLLHNGCIILTNSTGQNSSVEGTRFSASQKFPTYIILINSFYPQYHPPMHIIIHKNPINTEHKWTRKRKQRNTFNTQPYLKWGWWWQCTRAQCTVRVDLHRHYSVCLKVAKRYNFTTTFTVFKLLEPIGDFTYHQFSIQEFNMVNTLPLYVVYGSQNRQQLFPHTLTGIYNRGGECLPCGTDW